MSIITDNYQHNLHHNSVDFFDKNDPHLNYLSQMPYVFHFKVLSELPKNIPGIYTVSGGRQIGKTTLLKQWMLQLLQNGIAAESIFFMTGEIISDHISLISAFDSLLETCKLQFLIIDEITYIKDWDKGIKFLADAGKLSQIILVITGSDLLITQKARMCFPGRRGKADNVDFHIYPLSFAETVALKKNDNLALMFQEYLQHGGFLTAINELKSDGKISKSTYRTYSDWIRGDILKHNKQEHYLKSIVRGIVKRYGSQITWNSLAKYLPIDHTATIIDYVHLLERNDVCTIVESLIEDKLTGAPKKARKVYFTDPFILYALAKWEGSVINNEILGAIIESIVINHFKHKYQTFYINAEGEVDVAYVDGKNFVPIEIKWTGQIRSKDLKQIRKYSNGEVWGQFENLETVPPTYFLPEKLIKI